MLERRRTSGCAVFSMMILADPTGMSAVDQIYWRCSVKCRPESIGHSSSANSWIA
jgi:hypothetical protein